MCGVSANRWCQSPKSDTIWLFVSPRTSHNATTSFFFSLSFLRILPSVWRRFFAQGTYLLKLGFCQRRSRAAPSILVSHRSSLIHKIQHHHHSVSHVLFSLLSRRCNSVFNDVHVLRRISFVSDRRSVLQWKVAPRYTHSQRWRLTRRGVHTPFAGDMAIRHADLGDL